MGDQKWQERSISIVGVEKVTLLLQSRSQSITIDNVRVVLGTGNKTTIDNYLKQWQKRQEDSIAISLPQRLALQVTELYKKNQWKK